MDTDQNSYQKIDDQPKFPATQSVEINDDPPKLVDDANQLTATERRHRLSSLIVIGCLAFLTGMSYTIIVPTAWGYMNKFVSDKYAGIALGSLLSLYALSSAIAGVIFGYMYDIGIPLKRLILIGSLFQIIGNIFYYIGINIYVVVTSRFITGVGMGILPLLFADVSRRSTPETQTQLLTRIIGCRQIGFIFGPTATILLEPLHFKFFGIITTVYNAPGLLMAVLWFIMALVTLCLFHDIPIKIDPEAKSKPLNGYSCKDVFKRMHKACKKPALIVLLIATLVFFINQCAINTFLTPFVSYTFNWSTLRVSVMYGFIGVEVLIVYFILNFISKVFRDQTILLFGFVVLSTSSVISVIIFPLLSVGIAVTYAGFFLFLFLDMVAAPLINVTSISLISKHTKCDQQGMGLGIQNAVFSVAAIIGPLYAGALLGLYLILLISLLVIVLGATVLIAVFYRSLEVEKTDELSSLLPTTTDDDTRLN